MSQDTVAFAGEEKQFFLKNSNYRPVYKKKMLTGRDASFKDLIDY
jgi:hypothetical protein